MAEAQARPLATAGPERANVALPLEQIQKVLDDVLDLGEKGAMMAFDMIVSQAVHHRASDVHFEPWRDCLTIRFRLDGILHEVAMIGKQHQERLIARIKVLSNMVIYMREMPQDGRIDPHADRMNRSVRASTFPTVYGEKSVIRVLDHKQDLMRPDALGFRDDVVAGLRLLVRRPQGALLLTGPSSSGKSTTIYSLLRELMLTHASNRHIVTIEDPVEYQLGRVGQTQINPATGFTFEVALRSLLRQDPDVIMVGEIRDRETARIAIQAGLTGHLVISTIHSGTSSGVFTRLLDMGIEPFLAASAVTGVLAQRLLRSNCSHCTRPYTPDPEFLAQYDVPKKKYKFMKGAGCKECRGLGYLGRLAVGELLITNDEIAELIIDRTRTRTIQEAAVRNGMVTFLQDAVDRVLSGRSTFEELRMVIPPTDEVEQAMRAMAARAKTKVAPSGPKKSAASAAPAAKAKRGK